MSNVDAPHVQLYRSRRCMRLLVAAATASLAILLWIVLYSRHLLPARLATLESSSYSSYSAAAPLGTDVSVRPGNGNTGLDPKRVALILENRVITHLPSLILHFITVLPSEWVVRVVGSPSVLSQIRSSSAASRYIASGKLVLTGLPEYYPTTSSELISQTLTNLTLYRDFLAPAEWLLVFQSDSIICAASEYSLNKWVGEGWTYVGAPWAAGGAWGGNGGLSLRHVPTIIKLLETKTRAVGDAKMEDKWLCEGLAAMPEANMPSADVEKEFSVESVWEERPFGYHIGGSGKLMVQQIWRDRGRRRKIFEHCPEVKMILDVDLE